MKRILLAVSVLVLVFLACSSAGAGEAGNEQPNAAQEDSSIPPVLPDVQAGDCSADAGPGVNLAKCDLTERNYSGANLAGAILAQATLSDSNFSEVNLTDANLAGVFARSTNFLKANFTNADLTNADLRESNFIDADFTGAITVGADFSGSYMTGAIISQEQLDAALSLKGAILPDGSIGE
jgi:uncharacterized protein YjbI with pentapeptide repeats